MKNIVDEKTIEVIEKGGVLALLYFDMHGETKEKVEARLVELANKLSGEKGVVYSLIKIEKALELEEKKYSAAAEARILTDSLQNLVRVCVLYGPMGIEVLKPERINLSLFDTQELLFNVAQMSHEFTTTMLYKVLSPEDKKKLDERLKIREEMGKELLKKARKEKEEK